MLRLFTLFSLLVCCSVSMAEEKTSSHAGDFQKIFNGKDLSGWEGDPSMWSVKDGVIHGETTPDNKANGNTFLIWQDGRTKDFELKLSFRCSTENNSGIQYRSEHLTEGNQRNKWVMKGYQHEIRNSNKFPNVSGFIYDERGSRGRIILCGEKGYYENGKKTVTDTLISADEYEELFKVDEWNDVRIVAKGNHIQHYMNGKLVLDFTDKSDKALLNGQLALQLHAGVPMWAEFKDIQFKEVK